MEASGAGSGILVGAEAWGAPSASAGEGDEDAADGEGVAGRGDG